MKKNRLASAMVALLLACSALVTTANAQGAKGAPQPKVKVGDIAPDFTLRDQDGKDVSLHDFKGKKNVALAFVVFAFTGG